MKRYNLKDLKKIPENDLFTVHNSPSKCDRDFHTGSFSCSKDWTTNLPDEDKYEVLFQKDVCYKGEEESFIPALYTKKYFCVRELTGIVEVKGNEELFYFEAVEEFGGRNADGNWYFPVSYGIAKRKVKEYLKEEM